MSAWLERRPLPAPPEAAPLDYSAIRAARTRLLALDGRAATAEHEALGRALLAAWDLLERYETATLVRLLEATEHAAQMASKR